MQGVQKTMIRKLAIVLFSIFIFISCNNDSGVDAEIVAIDFPSYDAARAILGSTDNLIMLLPPGSESHHYEPTPKDMIMLSKAKLVIYTGGESDAWVDSILASLDNSVPIFKLVNQVLLLKEETKEGMSIDRHSDVSHEELDEHVWTSPINEIRIIENLSKVVAELYSDKESEILANSTMYITKLKAIDSEIREVVNSSKHKTMIFASRFPLIYFAKEYGLDYFAAFPGCAEETEPSASSVAFLIDKLKQLNLGYVLDIEFGSPLLASTIADEAGVEIRQFNSMHNITQKAFADGDDYITIMKGNIEVLKEVLN